MWKYLSNLGNRKSIIHRKYNLNFNKTTPWIWFFVEHVYTSIHPTGTHTCFVFHLFGFNMFMDKTVEYTAFTMTRFIQMKIIISKCETPLLNIMMCFYTGKLDNHSYFYSIWQVESPLYLVFSFFHSSRLSLDLSFPHSFPRLSSLFIHSLFLSFLFHFLLSKSVSFFILSPRFSPSFKQSVVFSPICSALFSISRYTFPLTAFLSSPITLHFIHLSNSYARHPVAHCFSFFLILLPPPTINNTASQL